MDAQGEAHPYIPFAWNSVTGLEDEKHVFPEYGDCYAGGSGADAFRSLLSNNAVARLPAETPPLESAICVSLSHLGKLAGDQMRRGAGIDSFFGGAFEIVTRRVGQLQKIGDVATPKDRT